MKNNPIPPDQARWGRFDELFERSLYILRDILTEAQLPGNHSGTETMVGNFYHSCRDESAIEKQKTAPLTPTLDQIQALKTKTDLIRQIAIMHRDSISALFEFYPQPDLHAAGPRFLYKG
jgi:putative endopeptidase